MIASPLPRRRTPVRRSLGRTLRDAVVDAVALVLVVAGLSVLGAGFLDPQVPGYWDAATPQGAGQPPARVAALMAEFDCSIEGFESDEDPRSAIVRNLGGKLRVVSFDDGWETYRDDPGALVAVCLAPPR